MRNTAAHGDAADDNSTCEHPSPQKQPDLMAASAPPGDPSTPLFEYSSDLAGTYDGGLATARAGTSCVHSYPSAQADDLQGRASGACTRGAPGPSPRSSTSTAR